MMGLHFEIAIKMLANYIMNTRARARFGVKISLCAVGLAGLAGCTLPQAPVQPATYDFGATAAPAPAQTAQTPQAAPSEAALPALAVAEIEASAALDGTAMLYRLNYQQAHQLQPYTLARWSAPPAQLVRQRLREHLGHSRTVLSMGEAATLNRTAATSASRLWALRLELEEFSQQFDSPTQSRGVIRLRATLSEKTPVGDRLLAQRAVAVSRPAATADAPGGVLALTAATDAAVAEIGAWLAGVR